MDRRTNPYAPGAGLQPPELAGRDRLLQEAAVDTPKSAKILARGRARHARFHFLRRDIFDVRADRPLVTERI